MDWLVDHATHVLGHFTLIEGPLTRPILRSSLTQTGGLRGGGGTLLLVTYRKMSPNAAATRLISALGAVRGAGSWASIVPATVVSSCGIRASSRQSKSTPSMLPLSLGRRRLGGDRSRRRIGDTTTW